MAKDSKIYYLPIGTELKSKERTYRIIEVLGSGSFGITYKAEANISIGNITRTIDFAIKEHFVSASCYRGSNGKEVHAVPSAEKEVEESKTDFITEAKRLRKLCLKTRNIVNVNETFEDNGTAYYVMEYLDGGNPAKCNERKAIDIISQIAKALDSIHDEKVLHLDVKPDNIVMKTNGGETYPVLIDFGIAKHFDSEGHPTSSFGARGATSGYAPQEQYAGVNEFSPKFDIYALGAVLFYLCTGKNPPDAFKVSPNQIELKKELEGSIVSASVKKAILNAMKPSALERTPTIRQFCDDLYGIDFVPTLEISCSQLNFRNCKGQQSVSVKANISWTAYSEKDWCKVSYDSNRILISVSTNKNTENRHCNVVISVEQFQISQIIRIKQEGIGTVVFPHNPTWWKCHRKKVYQIGIPIFIGCCVGLYMFLQTDIDKKSIILSEAIATMDGQALKIFAEQDSIRAFYPYAQYLANQKEFNDALIYANKAITTSDSLNAKSLVASINAKIEGITTLETNLTQTLEQEEQLIENVEPIVPVSEVESNDDKFARASNDFNLMLSLAKDKYTKAYYPLAIMYFDKGDNNSAKSWANKAIKANMNRVSAQNLLAKIEDKLFAKATTLEDYMALAKNGYKKAYARLAEMYLRNHDYDNAHIWALKARDAKAGLDKARNVVDVLDSYGYYDNGEHGGKPNF